MKKLNGVHTCCHKLATVLKMDYSRHHYQKLAVGRHHGTIMTRSERLLELLQALRRRRSAVSGATLATELGISIRTLYRDIASLQAQGAHITGEPGVGYLLRPGYMLPPLMFSQAELEALMLGMRWVNKVADPSLRDAAANAFAKISAVLPGPMRAELEDTTLLVGPRTIQETETVDLEMLRSAMRQEQKCN